MINLKFFLDLFRHKCYNESKRNSGGGMYMEMFGEVDSVDFAIYLNKIAKKRGLDVNVTKIQKWLYICYGVYITVSGDQLLTERPKAWNFGPAFPSVHKLQKKNNDSLDGLEGSINDIEKLKKYDSIINSTLDTFGNWSATQLVDWTHEEDTAWDKRLKDNDMYSNIHNQDIINDFRKIVDYEY